MLQVCPTHGLPAFADGRPFSRPVADPTGTGPLRRQFMRASDKRWRAAARIIGEALGSQNILGLGGATMGSVALGAGGAHHPPLPHADKIVGFSQWLGSVLDDAVLGRDGSWMTPFVRAGVALGQRRGAGIVGHAASFKPSTEQFLTQHYNSLAVSELRGVIAFTLQRGTRAAASVFATRLRPIAAARAMQSEITVGMKRSRLMADYLVSKAFTAATVETYRAAGIGRVGIVPERIKRQRIGDKVPTPGDVVEVQTAGDDKVCPTCEAIAAAGPYSLDEALSLIPAHPACRCEIVPDDVALAALPAGGLMGLGEGLAGLFAMPHAAPAIEPLVEPEMESAEEAPEEAAGAFPEKPAATLPTWLKSAAVGLGATAIGLLTRREREPLFEGVETAPAAAAAGEPVEFPETFAGKTAADYADYWARLLAWAAAFGWPADAVEERFDEELPIRERLKLTSGERSDLESRIDETKSLL